MLMSHHLDAHVPSHTLYAHVPSPTLDAHVPSPTLDAHVPSPTLDAHVPSPTLDAHVPSHTLDAHVKDTFMMTMKEVKSYRMHYSNSTPKEMSHSFMLQANTAYHEVTHVA